MGVTQWEGSQQGQSLRQFAEENCSRHGLVLHQNGVDDVAVLRMQQLRLRIEFCLEFVVLFDRNHLSVALQIPVDSLQILELLLVLVEVASLGQFVHLSLDGLAGQQVGMVGVFVVFVALLLVFQLAQGSDQKSEFFLQFLPTVGFGSEEFQLGHEGALHVSDLAEIFAYFEAITFEIVEQRLVSLAS